VNRVSFLGLAWGTALTACVTAPQIDLAPAEQVARDAEVVKVFEPDVRKIVQPFEPSEGIREGLSQIALRLKAKAEAFSRVEPRIELTKQSRLTYSLPELKVFLPLSLLQNIRYENEIAAAIALEMALLEERVLVEKFSSTWPKDWDEEGMSDRKMAERVWARTKPRQRSAKLKSFYGYRRIDIENALPEAVTIMYQAGYDSRGLAGLWKRHYSRHWPRSGENASIVQSIYRAINQYPPLLNPIVNTSEFERLKQRIDRL
jgi:hypothetical protein